MRAPKTDLVGKKFGRLKAISFEGRNKGYDSLWKCICDCGKEGIWRGGVLKNGHTQSCGCLQKERVSEAKKTHGLCHTNKRLYKVWGSMKQRCFNPKSKHFKDYGGRGITVCNEWSESYEEFYNWATKTGYKPGLTIERNDVDGNYCPDNCKWIPKSEQSQNRRNSYMIMHNGVLKNTTELSKILGVSGKTIAQRKRRGATDEQAIKK